MKVISLIDNVSKCACAAEHGLSLYVELDCGARVLFDTGQGSLFAENAAALGIDLSTVDLAVISHGHYDHAGGLDTFLKINRKAKVYIRESAFEGHHSVKPDGLKDIGVCRPADDRLVSCGEIENLPFGITLFSNPPSDFPEPPGNRLLLGPDGGKDNFNHEQSMLVEESGRAVLFGGCAHRGIANILEKALEISCAPITTVFSGMHLKDASDEYIESLAEILLSYDGVKYYTMHCTGEEGFAVLAALMGDRISYLSCGQHAVR